MNRQWLAALALVLGFVSIVHAETILYQEDFEDGNAPGITVHYGQWVVGSGITGVGGYHALGYQNVLTFPGIPSDNVAFDVDFVISNGAWGDFELWMNAAVSETFGGAPDHGYGIMVNPVGSDDPLARIGRYTTPFDGIDLDSTPNTLAAGVPQHMRVERAGAQIQAFLNGEQILTASDSTYSGGLIGIRLAGEGVIDNIVVTAVPEPTALVMLALGLLGVLRRM